MLVVVTWSSCLVVAWFGQISAAQDAADLASLAAAGALSGGAEPCEAARVVAARNKAELIACTVRGDHWSFVVDVRVSRQMEPAVPGVPRHVERMSSAGTVQ